MTKDEYRMLDKRDLIILEDSANIVTSFMTDSSSDKDEYKEHLISNIENFFCKRTNKRIVEKNLGIGTPYIGGCKSVPKRKFINRLFNRYKGTKLNSIISINDSLSNNYLSNLMIAIHEVNHADTNQYMDSDNNKYYVSVKKATRVNQNKWNSIGDGLLECLNELYTQIQFYKAFPSCYENIKSVDDLIYKPFKPVFIDGIIPNGETYRDLGLLAKLLIIACDNDLTVSYNSLKNTEESFVNKSVKLNDGKHYIKNDLLYVGKYGARDFEKNFDMFTNEEGSYERLLKDFDHLLWQIRKYERPDKDIVNDVINIVDRYKENKYNAMVDKGLWGQVKRLHSNMIYETYKTYVKSMFRLYPARVSNILQEEKVYRLKKTGND